MSLLQAVLTAVAVSNAGSTDDYAFPWTKPKAQQRGQITYFPRSILSSPGNPRAYVPDARNAGKLVRFRSGLYTVGPAGNLICA